jgi:hypothetical protein
MSVRILKTIVVSLAIIFSANTCASLVNLVNFVDSDGDSGFTLDVENYNLEWRDLDLIDSMTYNEVKDFTQLRSDTWGYRIATASEVMYLVQNMFANYELTYGEFSPESISLRETVNNAPSSFIEAFDIMGGRLRTYDFGWLSLVRFSAFFDSGDQDSIGIFQLLGHESCDGNCSGDAMNVSIIRDIELVASLRDRDALHDSVMLVREVRTVSAPHSFALLLLGLFCCARRRFK